MHLIAGQRTYLRPMFRWYWFQVFVFSSSVLLAQNRLRSGYEQPVAEPRRAFAFPFASENESSEEFWKSRYFLSLGGWWKIKAMPQGKAALPAFEKPLFNDRDWISFQMSGLHEPDGNAWPAPASAGNQNSVSDARHPGIEWLCRKKFSLPAGWKSKKKFIHIGPSYSPFRIWLNGRLAAACDAPAAVKEFDISPLLQEGENTLALQISPNSTPGGASTLPDFPGFQGGELYIFFVSGTWIRDFHVRAGLENQYQDGILEIDLSPKTYGPPNQKIQITATLKDPQGNVIWTEGKPFLTALNKAELAGFFKTRIPVVKAWSAESPVLYTLFLRLETGDGKVLQVIRQEVGFRDTHVEDSRLLVNGKAIKIKGFNLVGEDANPAIRPSVYPDLLKRLKRLHVNAVWAGRQFCNPAWFELCNRYGLMVVEDFDPAKMQSQSWAFNSPATAQAKGKWNEEITGRLVAGKNQACIVARSLLPQPKQVNDCASMLAQIENLDKTRPCLSNYGWQKNPCAIFLQSCSAQEKNGKETGILAEYPCEVFQVQDLWKDKEAGLQLQGGFAGGMGQKFHYEWGRISPDFSGNVDISPLSLTGLLQNPEPDCPEMQELKNWYSPVQAHIEWLDEKYVVVLSNQNAFISTPALKGSIVLYANGKEFGTGDLKIPPILPGREQVFSFLYPEKFLNPLAGQKFLNRGVEIRIFTLSDSAFFPAGFQIYQKMVEGKGNPKVWQPRGLDRNLPEKISENDTSWMISDAEFRWEISRKTGHLSLWHHGKWLPIGFETTCSFGLPGEGDRPGNDHEFDLSAPVTFKKSEGSEPCFTMVRKSRNTGSGSIQLHTQVFLTGKRSFVVRHMLESADSLRTIFRFSDDWQVPSHYDSLEYYGRGPEVSHPDRCNFGRVANFSIRLPDAFSRTTCPENWENHVEVKSYKLLSANGRSIAFFSTGQEFSCGVSSLPVGSGPAGDKTPMHRLRINFRPQVSQSSDRLNNSISDSLSVSSAIREWSYRVELK
jgi:beta-galactosidase